MEKWSVDSRRDFLCRCALGMGGLGLAGVLGDSGWAAPGPSRFADSAGSASVNPLAPKVPPLRPRARRVIHFFLNGGPSHVDTFDPKPALTRYAGQPLPTGNLPTERKTGAAFPSPFSFRQYGASGIPVSEVFSRTAAHVDDMAVIRSMKANVPNHEPSLMLMNCGDSVRSRPSVGSWVTYGLGSENLNLPGFVAMCPGGYPIKEAENWQAGFLPGIYQGTFIDSRHRRVDRLIENIRSNFATPIEQRRQLDLLRELNEIHRRDRVGDGNGDARLEARIESFELAYRMQMEAEDVFDIGDEPKSIRDLYGDGVHGRQTLIARRLLERGVRYVQLWHGAGQPWDHHGDIEKNLRKQAAEIDQPIAALLTDLKLRGMLDDTLVIWGGEFGRTPSAENGSGRDHNHYGFTVWMAGGGVKGGTIYGATDEFGFQSVHNTADVHDLHATILFLLGFDHEQFTYRHAGRDFRLTDVAGRVLHPIIA